MSERGPLARLWLLPLAGAFLFGCSTTGSTAREIQESVPSGDGPRLDAKALPAAVAQSLRPFLFGPRADLPCSATSKRHDADGEIVVTLDVDLGKCVERANAGEAVMRDMTRGINGRIRGENVYECRARKKAQVPFSMAPATKSACIGAGRFSARLRRTESLPKDLGGGKLARESYTICTASGDCDVVVSQVGSPSFLLRAQFRSLGRVTVTVGGWHGKGKLGRTLQLPMRRGGDTQLVELRVSN